MFRFGPDILHDLDAACAREWLLTDGVGGFASSTLAGLHTRRYHGLLIAGERPLHGRRLLVSKLSEGLCFGRRRVELDCNRYPGVVHPEGHLLLREVTAGGLVVEHVWEAEGGRLTRRLAMDHGRSRTAAVYRWEGEESTFLELRPLVSCRDFHHTFRACDAFESLEVGCGLASLAPRDGGPTIHFGWERGEVEPVDAWYYNMQYSLEAERGLDFEEDLYCPGVWRIPLADGDSVGVVLGLAASAGAEAHDLLARAEARQRELLEDSPFAHESDARLHALTVSADSFLATRGEGLPSVIAGYPWFLDWGRDAMIALPGLTMLAGHGEVAREVILGFARHMREGLIPNRFPEAGEEPDYNTVDATLWMFVAAWRLAESTGEMASLARELWPAIVECLEWHIRGTRYGIGVDPADGLLHQGDEGTQLTWMDAKVGDWVVTPRRGKPVEIQGLWINALRIGASFAECLGETERAAEWDALAERAIESFGRLFWLDQVGYLADVLTAEGPDTSLRPNQAIALSLPFEVLDRERALCALDAVRESLLTPYGLRSLAPDAPGYRGSCVGSPIERDGAYHQGTVWAWLIGPWCRAWMRVHEHSAASRGEVRRYLEPLLEHTREAGIGSISEILDGDPPHTPRGCFAQAWSVAEVLDVLLDARPQFIRMDLADLSLAPEPRELPAGFELLTYEEDLLESWFDLLDAAFPECAPFRAWRWREGVVEDPRFHREGAFFVREVATGQLVATAYAWRESLDDPCLVRVEWVGAHPRYRGLGLGRLVMERLLTFMREAGYATVTLDTEAFRIPAVGLYLSLGFTPSARSRYERRLWEAVLEQLEAGG